MGFFRRQVITAALTANAARPLPTVRGGYAGFFPGWLVSELSPHLIGLTTADLATHLAFGRRGTRQRSTAGVALALGSIATLAYLTQRGRLARGQVETALTAGLGDDYTTALDALPTPADLATPWRALVNPFRFRNDDVVVESDVVYDPDHGFRGLLDIYRPKQVDPDTDKAPVLLQVHGGGWTVSRKDQQALPLMHRMAAKGWVVASINYRLAPKHPYPAQIIDVKKAIAWVRDNISDYGGDPDYIVITGGSAGGHLCSLAALTPNDPEFQPGFEDADTSVQACVSYYGVYDFAGATGLKSAQIMRDRFLQPVVVKRSFRKHPEIFEAASPILRVTDKAPDFLILHGTNDTLVDVNQARLMVEELRNTSQSTITYAELPGAQHAFDVFPSVRSEHVVRGVDRWLTWHHRRWQAGLETGSAESARQAEDALAGDVA